jgi:ribosomal protein S18 acetylase RimI-like enzyme
MDGNDTPLYATLADANLVASYHEYARWQEPCVMQATDGVFLMAGATRFPAACINGAIRTDRNVTPTRALALARDFFGSRRRGFSFVTRSQIDADLEDLLIAQGFHCDSDAPCMWVDRPVSLRTVPEGYRVEWLSEAHHVADLVRVIEQSYEQMGLPLEQVHAIFNRPVGLLSANVSAVLAYHGNNPVAVALAIVAPPDMKTAGIYWVGTVPRERGRGLAEHCTALATNIGFERGATIVTLQASSFGEPIYRRMGYREYARQRFYRHP